jgi:hypothetical protein
MLASFTETFKLVSIQNLAFVSTADSLRVPVRTINVTFLRPMTDGACHNTEYNDLNYYRPENLKSAAEGKLLLRIPRPMKEGKIKMDVKEQDVRIWSGYSWLRTGISGRLL